MSRRIRIGLGLGILAVDAVALVAVMPATVTRAASTAVAIDRQAYVPDAGADQYEVDACSQGFCGAPDPNNTHVAAQPNTITYHSLYHLEASELMTGYTTVQSLVVTLPVTNSGQQSQGDDVNNGSALLDAYPLKTELPATFSGCATSASCSPPAYDTSVTPVSCKLVTDPNAAPSPAGNAIKATCDVGPFLTYWAAHGGETGFAVVPLATATTQPFAISFDRTASSAVISGTVQTTTATAAPVVTTPPPVVATGGSSTYVAPAPVPGAVTAPPSAQSSPAPSRAAVPPVGRAVAPPSAPAPSAGVPWWLVVLVASVAASVALLAQPLSAALSSAAGARLGLMQQLQVHPRLFAVAGVMVVWSSGWGVYSGTVGVQRSTTASSVASTNTSGLPAYVPPSDTSSLAPGPTGAGSSAGASSGGSSGGATIAGQAVGAAAFQGETQYNPPAANLFSGADDTVGITDTTIQMCAHSALTFASAFNIGVKDLNVFWQMVDKPSEDPYPHSAGQAGIYNRKIVQPDGSPGIAIQDDGYQPSKAVQAAEACQAQSGGNFFLLSGIGFDQIPAVRVWAEQNHVLYLHHIATQTGTAGLQYSFTMLPSVEQIGQQMAEYYLAHMSGKKVGIIERQSSNWEPGTTAFKNTLNAAGQGGNLVVDDYVQNNQGDYTKEVTDMQTKGVDIVLIWENALAADSIIQQAANQQYVPGNGWLLFPFNLTLYTLNASSNSTMQQEIKGMQGMIPWPAYTSSAARCNPPNSTAAGSGITRNDADYQGVMKDIREFEAAYAEYDPTANLCADGGDLLFATWEAWKQVADLLLQCGVDCTRNKVAGLMLNGYHSQVGANCPVDFRGGDHHHGGGGDDVYAVKPENGGPGWYNTALCQVNIT
ncbi:MAG: ABC transporter substrate-binding protein [Candidatus Dormibacteria bacterium]